MERVRWTALGGAMLALLAAVAPAPAGARDDETAGQEGDSAPEAVAAPAGSPLSLTFDATWAGKYVWRGIVVTEDPVFEPSVEVGVGDLTLNVWANLDTTDVNDFDDQANEIDYTLDYSTSWKGLNLSVGAIHYAFPQAHGFDTTEAYLSLGADVPTAPTLTVYQDLDEHDGTYVTVGFGHRFADVWQPAVDVSMSVELGTQFAWGTRKHNAFYYGSGSGWADTTVGVALPFAVGERLTVTPYATYMWILDDGISSSLGRDDAFWAGLSVSVSF